MNKKLIVLCFEMNENQYTSYNFSMLLIFINNMRRAIKIKLNITENEKTVLLKTMETFASTFNFYSEWSVKNTSTSKVKAHKETYSQTKNLFKLPSALIQSARDMALESCL